MPEILIVDDDRALAEMLSEYFVAENFIAHRAENGGEALARIETRDFDLVVLDVMMPGLDGFEVLSCLRRRSDIPVLILTARGSDDDRVAGLELGADDYLAKPFNPRELVARIRAILRRRDSVVAAPRQALTLGPLALDAQRFRVSLAGRDIRLTTAEYFVLEALALRAGQIQSRETLTERALGRALEPYDRSVDTHVANIRRKLGLQDESVIAIRGVRGRGYVLSWTIPR